MNKVTLLTSTTSGFKLTITVMVGNRRVRVFKYDDIKMMRKAYTQLVGCFKDAGNEVIFNEGMLLWS